MKTLCLLAMLAFAGCGSAAGTATPDDAARIVARPAMAGRGEYIYDARQERDRAALMMILTASHPR